MNFLSNLPKITIRRKKRLGRGLGSNKGSKSGRGTTRHQKAREKIPLHFEGGQGRMVKKYPLLRGKGRNKSKQTKPLIITLNKLNFYEENEVVNIESLVKKGLVKDNEKFRGVKLLNNGELKKKLIVKIPVSEKAKSTIEKLGGKVEV